MVGATGTVFGECRSNETKARWWAVLKWLLDSSRSIPQTVVGVILTGAVRMWSRPACPATDLLNQVW